MSWVEELKTNILLIIENYKNKFNDAPAFVDLIENDLEFEKVAQHLLVMHQISDYDGYTIIEQDDQNFRKWVHLTQQPRFKKHVRRYWKDNPRILEATKNMAAGTAMLTELLGGVTKEQLSLLHDIFYGQKPKIRV